MFTSRLSISRASSLSSITSTRRLPPSPAGSRAAVGFEAAVAGSRTVKRLPRPRPALQAVTVPPWRSTMRCTSVRPIPRPPSVRSSERSPCTNSSNTCGSSSGAMPAPVSSTTSVAVPASSSTRTVTPPPAGVYFSAFSTRLLMTCSRRTASPTTQTGRATSATSPRDHRGERKRGERHHREERLHQRQRDARRICRERTEADLRAGHRDGEERDERRAAGARPEPIGRPQQRRNRNERGRQPAPGLGQHAAEDEDGEGHDDREERDDLERPIAPSRLPCRSPPEDDEGRQEEDARSIAEPPRE